MLKAHTIKCRARNGNSSKVRGSEIQDQEGDDYEHGEANNYHIIKSEEQSSKSFDEDEYSDTDSEGDASAMAESQTNGEQ